ncbi:glycoside hydrolase family 76 protein [Pseudonocardia acidicola]|uniref:Glycoside hydrolase n=1 Tax=Pseudonocardia acidicola TaxID=2724939 RepID=A0ABX1SGV0_9PSEU|nr:glycoside hydrolase family 76 protein [Pseudonocardia acidicola]NMI00795.1 glycoside hydrolase [Pseudonocardia acidicola]
MTGEWRDRAALAEQAVTRRHLRRLAGVLPGTRIGRIRWPRPLPIRPWPWHYWWQAHLLDCLVDAELRAPSPRRAANIAALARTLRLRNGGRWTNAYYDDIAWFGLAVQRAGALGPRSGPRALAAVSAQLRAGWTDHGGGGIWWRRGDDFKNAPANGPAAILLAREGRVELAASITDWMAATLVDPDTGLVRDGVRVDPDGAVRAVEATVYTYCQGVYLGACVELAERDGDDRWAARAAALLDAVSTRLAGPDGVIPGYDDGGDGGLFNGILARYLTDAAGRRPELASAARRIVLASAEAAWDGRAEPAEGPVFAPDWRRPARRPIQSDPEADLSVQLSGWMLLEAAADLERAGQPG